MSKRNPKAKFVGDIKIGANWRGFTRYRDGFNRWYRNAPRHVCGKRTLLEAVEDVWAAKKHEIDRELNAAILAAAERDQLNLREALGEFYEFLDHRVATGKPEPMAPVTAEDYKNTLDRFARTVDDGSGGGMKYADRLIGSFAPPDFGRFAKDLAEHSPTTVGRVVAYIQSFFAFCKDEGVIGELPQYGRYFVKPPRQEHRDKRLAEEKSYTAEQIRTLWQKADTEEKLWMTLGLNGAMDNADIAHLTHDVLDRDKSVIDYRRRKRGKIRRVIPVRPEFWQLLDRYRRPAPVDPAADGDRVFLTPTGLPLQRLKTSERSGRTNTLDYLAMQWVRLMIRAGLRPKLPPRRKTGRQNKPDEPRRDRRFKAKGSAAGQGFRGLRTTFPNLAPVGYRDEVEIIMGHSHGSVLVENYLERFGTQRLRELVDGIWTPLNLTVPPLGDAGACPGSAADPQSAGGPDEDPTPPPT